MTNIKPHSTNYAIGTGLLAAVLLVSNAAVGDTREQARRMHDRLTGTPPTDAMLDAMELSLSSGRSDEAAFYAMDGAPSEPANGNFYTVVLKNWISPWTNEAQDSFVPLNDYSATVIGLIRDEADFRDVLSADVLYIGQGAAIPPYSNSDNDHYDALERSGANLGDSSVLVRRTQSGITGLPPAAVAGVISTRAAARAYFVDGTNRAMFRFTMLNHLCMDLEQLKDGTRPTDRIRQDISRSPGGDSTLFLNSCVDCHSGMDPMAQAFAFYDFPYPDEEAQPGLELDQRKDQGQLVYTAGSVQDKYLINSATFVTGYVTPNDQWTNYWRLGDNSGRIGWRNSAQDSGGVNLAINPAFAEGAGAASLGSELASSDAFSECQVKKVFRSICVREPGAADSNAFSGFVSGFNNSHNIKNVFAQVASYCSAPLGEEP